MTTAIVLGSTYQTDVAGITSEPFVATGIVWDQDDDTLARCVVATFADGHREHIRAADCVPVES